MKRKWEHSFEYFIADIFKILKYSVKKFIKFIDIFIFFYKIIIF